MSTLRHRTECIRREREAGRRFVALLMPDNEEVLANQRYYGNMISGLNAALFEKGILLRPVQCLQIYQRDHFLETPRDFYVGVAMLGPLYTSRLFIEAVIDRLGGPKVMLDHHLEGLRLHSVREDAITGMRALTEHLLSLGHCEFGYVDVSDPAGNPWKRQGVNQVLREAGLPELGRGKVAGCRTNLVDVATALDWFEGLTPRPTAIICSDDTRAHLLLQAAEERGLRVPEDISVTGFGNYWAGYKDRKFLTSMAVDAALIGRKAAELLAGDPDAPPVSVLVPPEMIVRESSGPANRDRGATQHGKGLGDSA